MKKTIEKIRELKNSLKLLLGYMSLWFIMNIMDIRNVIIINTHEGGITGLKFSDGDTPTFFITLLFIYWIFWGFKKKEGSV